MSKKTFQINSTLYPEILLQEAIDAFSDYTITYSGGILSIEDEDPQYVFDEFMNYILSLSLENFPWA